MEKLQKIIEGAGLPPKEALIYLTLIKEGQSSTTMLSSSTKIKRTTIYQHIQSLLEKGFILRRIKGKRTFYTAENPKKMTAIIEKRKQDFINTLPLLTNYYNESYHKPKVELYEGKEEVRKLFLDISDSVAPINAFFSVDKFFKIFNKKQGEKFIKNIKINENTIKDLITTTRKGQEYVSDIKKERARYHKAKLLPKDFNISVDILISGNKVAMVSFDYLMGVLIENKEIADFHNSIHKFLWKNLK